jgi:hypothetical protein
MSSKYKAESNENDLKFPMLFGTWVNEEQRLALYLSPDKCKEDEFILDEERYTREEIHEMFKNDKTLDFSLFLVAFILPKSTIHGIKVKY